MLRKPVTTKARVAAVERYARPNADETTISVSKRAALFLARKRADRESTAEAVDRLLGERRSSGKFPEPMVTAVVTSSSAARTSTG
jgi:hypothetical protein